MNFWQTGGLLHFPQDLIAQVRESIGDLNAESAALRNVVAFCSR
jgi:hypothetical protein